MKKIMTAYVLILCVLLSSCAIPASKEEDTNTNQNHFSFEFADAQKGKQLLMSNTEYHNNLSKADLEYRLQKKVQPRRSTSNLQRHRCWNLRKKKKH